MTNENQLPNAMIAIEPEQRVWQRPELVVDKVNTRTAADANTPLDGQNGNYFSSY